MDLGGDSPLQGCRVVGRGPAGSLTTWTDTIPFLLCKAPQPPKPSHLLTSLSALSSLQDIPTLTKAHCFSGVGLGSLSCPHPRALQAVQTARGPCCSLMTSRHSLELSWTRQGNRRPGWGSWEWRELPEVLRRH